MHMTASEPQTADSPINTTSDRRQGTASRRGERTRRAWLLGVLIAVIVVLATALGLSLTGLVPALRPADAAAIPVGQPVIVSEQQLRAYGDANGTVYWAGALADRRLELTRTGMGATFIRYLPEGVKVGSKDKYLTVATYPQAQGYQLLQATANTPGISSQKTKSGALVVVNPKSPSSTYFSFANANFQVEVFSPTKGQSTQLVLDGKIGILGTKSR